MIKFCSSCALPLAGLDNVLFCPGCGQDLGRQPAALTLRGPDIPTSGRQPVAFDGGDTFDSRGTWQQYQTMQSIAPWSLPSGGDGVNLEAWRRSPARSPEFGADVVVVAGQAALIGLSAAILSFPLPWMVSGLPWWSFGPVGLGTFAIATLILVRGNRAHIWNEEHISQESPEQPEARREEAGINVSHTNADGRFIRGLNVNLPAGVTMARFYDFAKGVTRRGGSLAVDGWTGAGKLFSKSEYNSLLEMLDEAGIITWRNEENHSVGRKLPGHGRRALLTFCTEYEANK